MPAIITHSFFADDVLKKMGESVLKSEISARRNLFRLGAQGPDLFFYYKAAPWVSYDGIEKLGNIMHDNKVGAFYSESFRYLLHMDPGKDLFDLAVYIAGYLCHYSLDRTAHPFIHYTAGIDIEHSRVSWKYHIFHRILESAIDYLVLKDKGIDPITFRSYELVKVEPSKYQSVIEYYRKIIADVYDMQASSKQLQQVITDIYDVMRHLYDPSGIKYYLYRFLEMLTGKPGGITSSMMPRKINSEIDYYNLKYKPWYHPCDDSIVSRESFPDIYSRALEEASGFLKAFSDFIDSGEIPSGLVEKIGNISYSTGEECRTPVRLKHFDSIFEPA